MQIYQADLVSRKLADALPHWQEWYENLSSLQGIVTSLYKWRQFDGNIFVECLTPQKNRNVSNVSRNNKKFWG